MKTKVVKVFEKNDIVQIKIPKGEASAHGGYSTGDIAKVQDETTASSGGGTLIVTFLNNNHHHSAIRERYSVEQRECVLVTPSMAKKLKIQIAPSNSTLKVPTLKRTVEINHLDKKVVVGCQRLSFKDAQTVAKFLIAEAVEKKGKSLSVSEYIASLAKAKK